MEPLHTAIAFEAFGARIGIRTADSLASGLRPRLPPGARLISTEDCDTVYSVKSAPSGSGPDAAGFHLTRDGVAIRSSSSLAEISGELESDMHFHVALAARDFLFVHAGVVQWMGRAVVVPGRTETGKSSLIMALTHAGAEYYSDEYAVLDREGRVHAYPKPLSQRRDGAPPRLHPPEALGGRPEQPALPLGITVVTSYREGATWSPRPISGAQALMALFDNTVVARTKPDFALAVLAKAARGTGGLEGERGEAAHMASALLEEVSRAF